MAYEKAVPTVTFEDLRGNHATMSMDLGESLVGNWLDKSDAIMQAFQGYSEAKVVRRADVFSHNLDKPKTVDFDATAPYRRCDQKAVMTFFRESSLGVPAGYFTMSLPAPKESMFEDQDGGTRVKKSVGDAIAASLSDVVSCTFVEGWLKGKK